jgi:excisionase family DNA binding protein
VPKGKKASGKSKNKGDSPPNASSDATLTVPDLAEYLRVHPTTIYRLLRTGRIPAFRAGNSWRFDRAAITRWEEQHTAAAEIESTPPARRKGRKPKSKQS